MVFLILVYVFLCLSHRGTIHHVIASSYPSSYQISFLLILCYIAEALFCCLRWKMFRIWSLSCELHICILILGRMGCSSIASYTFHNHCWVLQVIGALKKEHVSPFFNNFICFASVRSFQILQGARAWECRA